MIYISTINYSIAKSLGWTELTYIEDWDCYLGIPPNGNVGNMFGLKLKVPNFLLKPGKIYWKGPTDNLSEFDKVLLGFLDWVGKNMYEKFKERNR